MTRGPRARACWRSAWGKGERAILSTTSESRKIRAALVDDEALFRAALRALLLAEPDIAVVAEAGDAESALRILSASDVDVAAIDLLLGGPNGLSLMRRLRRARPQVRMLALTGMSDRAYVEQALDAGALGYVLKDDEPDALVAALREVAEGRRFLSPNASRALASGGNGLACLTARERELFDLLVQGLNNHQAAEAMDITVRTVETHRSRILRKLGAHGVDELVRIAARYDLI